jgi:hypothetical protein
MKCSQQTENVRLTDQLNSLYVRDNAYTCYAEQVTLRAELQTTSTRLDITVNVVNPASPEHHLEAFHVQQLTGTTSNHKNCHLREKRLFVVRIR